MSDPLTIEPLGQTIEVPARATRRGARACFSRGIDGKASRRRPR
jgi:hypothetical protein